MSLQGIVYEEPSFGLFLLVTCLMGGWTAWRTGRAVARGWGSYPRLIIYVLLLGIAVRFIHHALFEGTMFSLRYYIADTVVLMAVAFLGFRRTRTRQMTGQYRWLYESNGPFAWRKRAPQP